MKRIIFSATALLMCSGLLMAQGESDILLMSRTQMNGTARSVALGGAMGALGGDMSSIAINPAGIGVYRSSEFAFTTGVNYNGTYTDYHGTKMNDEHFNLPINQIGYVGTWMPMREVTNGVVSTHFGIGYNRINGFDQNFIMGGNSLKSSMLSRFVIDATGKATNQLGSFGAELAYDAYLLDLLPGMESEYYQAHEYINDQNQIVMPNTINQRQKIEKNGYGGEYAFTFGMNVSNLIQLGASLNFQSLVYDENNAYREQNNYDVIAVGPLDVDYFEYYRNTNLRGTSINAKLGVIVRPIQQLRVGLAYHTPNWYQVTQEYNERMVSHFHAAENNHAIVDSPYSDMEYKFRTPGKFVASIAGVMERGLVSVDYEYTDYSQAKFTPAGGNFDIDNVTDPLNQSISIYYQPAHTIRVGAEMKLTDQLLGRLGAGYYGSPIKSEYTISDMARTTYSAGLGYRTNFFFCDVAYMMATQKEDHYAFNYDASVYDYLEPVSPVAVSQYNHQVSVTFGWKF
ncbi:MAG: outer membrane protein transport protein [Marinilabiliaceae bacterium]|nr:outer membrane protein transport protein [Marinilabiliaceae bacterium]